jgi:Tfp pilus assembly PilM family ATPase
MPRHQVSEAFLKLALGPRNLAKSLSRSMAGSMSQASTVLSLDGRWLKLLQAEGPPNARRITKLAALPVEGSTLEEIRKAFKEACAVEELAVRDVLVTNPTHLCTVRIFAIPSTDPKELRDIVELQAEKHTPYAKEEILTDFKITARDRGGYSRVLLIIAHQDVIHRPVQLVESLGLTLDRVGCELEGLLNWYLLTKRASGGSSGPSLVVDVDGGTSTALVVHQGQPQFHRSLPMGAEQLEADPASALERFVNELVRSMEAIEAEGASAKIQDVLLTGCTERLGELKTLIERGLDVPVTVASPWIRELPESARSAVERLPDVSFAGLVGLALGPSHIDLTPKAAQLRQAFESRARSLVLLGCQCVAAFILVSILLIGRAQNAQRYYTGLRVLYQQSAQQAGQVEAALAQIALVKARFHSRGQLLEALETLATLSPPDIQWTSLTFTQDEVLVLKGTSGQLPKIYEFVAALESSPLFGQVEARRVIKRKSEGKEVNDFEISCPLVGDRAEG